MKKLKIRLVKLAIIPILMLFTFQMTSCKKETFDISLLNRFSIQSTATGATYQICVALPENYDPKEKYATIYVLDGEKDFCYVANQAKEISTQKNVNNAIVVGISYGNDRSLDYTPTKAKEGGGGAQHFMGFIKDELIPKMEQEYAVDTSRSGRVILGHSFGGLLSAYAFTKFNSVFGNYIILSPSLWYDDEVIFQYEQESRAENQGKAQLVFMGLGGRENTDRMATPFETFYQRLKANYTNIRLAENIEPKLRHMSSKEPNIREGLRFYFDNR